MQIIKQKRNYWRIEPGTTAMPYATLELTSGYDNQDHWQYGWHVRLRAPDGAIVGWGGVYPTGKDAASAAIALLTR